MAEPNYLGIGNGSALLVTLALATGSVLLVMALMGCHPQAEGLGAACTTTICSSESPGLSGRLRSFNLRLHCSALIHCHRHCTNYYVSTTRDSGSNSDSAPDSLGRVVLLVVLDLLVEMFKALLV